MKVIKRLIILIIILGFLYVGFIEVRSFQIRNTIPSKDAEYVIVLGAKANGKNPSKLFKERLDAAVAYLKDNDTAKIIVSGGQGSDEDYPESYVGKQYLIAQGIDETKVLEENASTNTFENLTNIKVMLPRKDTKIVIISNDFHIFRVHLLGERLSLNASYIGATSAFFESLPFRLREYVAIGKSYFFDLP